MQISVRVLPDLVEAAVRIRSHRSRRHIALQELREIATASGTSWALGLARALGRCRGRFPGGRATSTTIPLTSPRGTTRPRSSI